MKIINDTKVYVQKNDIAFLNQSDLPIPASIFMKVFGNGIVIIDDSNRYEFVEFTEPNEIEFFKGINWMIDYNEVKNLSEEETIELGQTIAQEKNKIAERFNSMKPEDREKNMNMVSQCELLDFKMYSLRDVLWFKQGHLAMELPDDIEYPSDYQKPTPKKEKGVKRLLKRFSSKKQGE